MWIFKLIAGEQGNQGRIFYLSPEKKEITVGRSNVTFVLENDSSISRKHCSLHIAKKEDCPQAVQTKTGIWAIDLSSKYGTYVKLTDEFQKLTPNEPFILPHGCLIRFGVIGNVWSVEYKPILLLFNSSIPSPLRMDMKSRAVSIGGDTMPFCDHRTSYVVANSYSLTEKILLALIHGIPLVTPLFIDKFMQAIKDNKAFPDPLKFKPILKEITVRLDQFVLEPGRKRNQLFAGFQFFVTCADRLQLLKPVVEAAGGNISVYEEKDRVKLLEEKVVVLETFMPEESQLSQVTSELKVYLEQHGKRTVPDREIPLAIAYNSTDRVCNVNCTDFSVRSTSSTVPHSHGTVLEDDTQMPKKMIEGHGVVECTPLEITSVPESQVEDESPLVGPAIQSVPESALTSSSVQPYHGPVLNKNIPNIVPPKIPSQVTSSQNPARKRVGSLDIFDEENPKKRVLSQQKIYVASNIFKTPNAGSIRSSGRNEGRSQGFSQLSVNRSTNMSCNEDDGEDANPFGKRKIIAETQESTCKRIRPSPEDTVPPEQEDVIRKSSLNISASKPVFTTPKPPPRLQPLRSAGGPASAVRPRSPLPTDEDGWIDVSDKKEEEKTPGDQMSTTVVMLSLVTIAPGVPAEPTTPQAGPHALKNVKIFIKQSLPEFNRTIDLQSVADFRDDEWLRITNC